MEGEREYMSIDDGAKLIGLSVWTLRQYLAKKKLKRFKAGRRTLVDKREVLGLVREETPAEATARNVAREQRKAKPKN